MSAGLDGRGVIGLMFDPWMGSFRNRKHHLMQGLASTPGTGPCLYVGPPLPGSSLCALRARGIDPGPPCPAGFLRPVPGGRLHVLTPVSGQLDAGTLQEVVESLAIRDPVCLVQSPLAADLALRLAPAALVYDCTDDYTGIVPELASEVVRGDRLLLERADLVTTVSRQLHRQKAAGGSRVRMLPNGVDPDRFDPSRRHPRPADLATGGDGPVVGYVGKVNYKLDAELVDDVARLRPGLRFVFIGPVFRDVSALARLDNVAFLGPRGYADLPSYLAGIDVCVIPHRVDGVTRFMNPIKAYEYLAMGRPVVATPVAGLEDLSSEIVTADGPVEFAAALDAALEARSQDDVARRRDLVRTQSWSARTATLRGWLEAVLRDETGRCPSQ